MFRSFSQTTTRMLRNNSFSSVKKSPAKLNFLEKVWHVRSHTKKLTRFGLIFRLSLSQGDDPSLKKSSDEIKKLQEEISSLRQENIQLKVFDDIFHSINWIWKQFFGCAFQEEALRQGRFAANALRLRDHEAPSSEALQFKNAQEPVGILNVVNVNQFLLALS